MTASPSPTAVISAPLRHALSPVTTVLAAPIRKCASVLMANDAMMAGYPRAKKNGMMGMNAPAAVESVADIAATHGFG